MLRIPLTSRYRYPLESTDQRSPSPNYTCLFLSLSVTMTMHPRIKSATLGSCKTPSLASTFRPTETVTHTHPYTVSLTLSYVSDNAGLITRRFARFGIHTYTHRWMHACISIRVRRPHTYVRRLYMGKGEILKVPANDGSVGPINAVPDSRSCIVKVSSPCSCCCCCVWKACV